MTRFGAVAMLLIATVPALGDTDDETDAEAAPEAQVVVATMPVAMEQVALDVTSYGIVEADPDATDIVAIPRAGVIRRVLVRLGQRVSAGDALVELDTAPGPTMQYAQAQAAVKYGEEQLARLQRMAANKLATREQVAQAQRDLSDAQASERSLRSVGANTPQQTLRSPKDAIVTQVLINAGDRTAADAPALSLAAVGGLIVRLGVEPQTARAIAPGMPVTLVSVFDAEGTIQASVKRVHAMLNAATRLVDVIVPIPADGAAALTLGSQMRGTIVLDRVDALIVPRGALLRDESGDYLFTAVGGQAHRVDVEVLRERSSDVAIAIRDGGLAAGDAIVVSGGYQLSDGVRVVTNRAGQ